MGPIEITFEKEETGEIICSDNYVSNYGVGETYFEAYRDFLLSSIEYLDIVGHEGFSLQKRPEEYELVCKQCGESFISVKKNKKFDSQDCRNKFYRELKKS